jgi:hypothetical protein
MTGRPARDYTRCPSCSRRTVLFHYGRKGEDYLACSFRYRDGRRCSWETFRWPADWDTQGHKDVAAWAALNPRAADTDDERSER